MHKKLILTSCLVAILFVLVITLGYTSRNQAALPLQAELIAAKGGQSGGNDGQDNQGDGQGNQGNGNGDQQGNQGGGQGNQGDGNGGGQGNQGGGNDGDQGSQNNQGVGDGVGGGKENNRGQHQEYQAVSNGNDQPEVGGRGDDGAKASIQGRGLRQHAAVLDHVLTRYGLHTQAARTYEYRHPNIHPAGFASRPEEHAWGENLHAVTCSMFQYLRQIREIRPDFRVDYVEWIVHRVAEALNEDPTEVKAALLGYPHEHDHTSPLLQGVSEEGCARGVALPVNIREQLGEEHELKDSDATSSRFTINDQSTNQEIAFQIMEDDAIFTDFGVSREKELHLLIVRDDLRHFAHLHPERDADGTWRVSYIPPSGGKYWFYVDFVDTKITHHTVRFTRTYDGAVDAYGFLPNLERRKRVGPYTVILQEEPYKDGNLLTFHIDDRNGAPLFDPYLGSMGHGFLLSQEGDFIHTHPSPVSDHLTLHIPKHLGKIYRMYVQFQIQQKLYEVEFDLMPSHNADE